MSGSRVSSGAGFARLNRGARRLARQVGGRLSASTREMPTFLVIGAQRGGTSSLYDYLSRHPAVLPASRKEVHFFDRNFHRGEAWYRAHFPRSRRLAEAGAITGEATPNYLFYAPAPSRVARLLPDARFVVLLRDPVARAHSAWRLMVESGFEKLGFEEAIAAEPERIGPHLGSPEDGRPSPIELFRYSYLERGRYAQQLERWFSYFDRDRFFIAESEAFFGDPVEVVRKVEDFLGLGRSTVAPLPSRNQAQGAALNPATRDRLIEVFQAENRRLEELLGRRVSWAGDRVSE